MLEIYEVETSRSWRQRQLRWVAHPLMRCISTSMERVASLRLLWLPMGKRVSHVRGVADRLGVSLLAIDHRTSALSARCASVLLNTKTRRLLCGFFCSSTFVATPLTTVIEEYSKSYPHQKILGYLKCSFNLKFHPCLAVAQWIERLNDYGLVAGSNPASQTTHLMASGLVARGHFVLLSMELGCTGGEDTFST